MLWMLSLKVGKRQTDEVLLKIGGILKAYRVGFCEAIYFCDLSSLTGRFLSSGKMKNAKMNFILAFFISTFATLSYCLFL